MASPAVYLDSSAVLRAVLEAGTSPTLEESIREAGFLMTSRLALVESARAFHRLRTQGRVAEASLVDGERAVASLWAHCEILELAPGVCELAERVAPGEPLRTLDALHLATFLLARRRFERLELLTADERLRVACARVGA
jgi:predicted nucleic acid-binding protein